MLIDGGVLRLDPLSGTPDVSEAQAIALFRASTPAPGPSPSPAPPVGMGSRVGPVSIVYALVTLRLAVPRDPTLVIQPRREPMFEHRAAWVIIGGAARIGGSLCADGRSTVPPPQPVELIAADGSGEALAYQTAGRGCGRTVQPQVAVAGYYVSLPWTIASRNGGRIVIRYAAPPACGDMEEAPTETGPTSATFSVYAYVAMAHPPCARPKQGSTLVRYVPPNATISHVNAGLSVGTYTSATTFTYFDGTTHTIP